MATSVDAGGSQSTAPDMVVDRARETANRALDEAVGAWHAYAALVDVGAERTRAFDVFDTLRNARRC